MENMQRKIYMFSIEAKINKYAVVKGVMALSSPRERKQCQQ
jgi:hypothetical protein